MFMHLGSMPALRLSTLFFVGPLLCCSFEGTLAETCNSPDIAKRPQTIWSSDHVVDNCTESKMSIGQTCFASCAEGYIGDAKVFRCSNSSNLSCTCFQGTEPACQPAHHCVGGQAKRPSQVFSGITDHCADVNKVNGTCTEKCVNNVTDEEFNYTCVEVKKNWLGKQHCVCFEGPTPRCPASDSCKLPAHPKSEYDFSDCIAASSERPPRSSCTVQCATGNYGNPSRFTCPEKHQAKRLPWNGTLPECFPCNSTKRPSDQWPFLHDDCDAIVKGMTCNATCKDHPSDPKYSEQTFLCRESVGAERLLTQAQCTCFTSDEPLLQCETQSKCVAPHIPKGDEFRYDISDCVNAGRHNSCTVQCAQGFTGKPAIFKCTGPPYSTTGTLPTCHYTCDIGERPQDVWSSEHVIDDCAKAQAGQLCTASCGKGFRGNSMPMRCMEDDGVTCNCFDGHKPECIPEHSACMTVPPIPNATCSTSASVPHGQTVQYVCLPGFTGDGLAGGPTRLQLLCKDGYFHDYENVGCARVRGPIWPSCSLNQSMLSKMFDSSNCHGKRDRESCTIQCAAGYYQPSPSRYQTVNPIQHKPSLMVCNNGHFHGTLPRCVQRTSGILEFNVYAALQSDPAGTNKLFLPGGQALEMDSDGGSLPANMNVYDLEGLLKYVYTDVFFQQQVLAETPHLYRDVRGNWSIPRPNIPVSRDSVDILVRYTLKIKNPSSMALQFTSNFEFGMFADFQNGGAANKDASGLFQQSGGVVGVMQQMPGYVEIGSASSEAGNCSDSAWIGTPSWMKQCAPRCDSRYKPVGRFNAFSLPGVCPNKQFGHKGPHGCIEIGGHVLQGGRCPEGKDEPDGSAECTYKVKEVNRIPLSRYTGMDEQSCGGAVCKNLRDFQLNCDNAGLRLGVKIAGPDDLRECTEYAVAATPEDASLPRSCNSIPVEPGQSWSCFGACNASEGSTPMLQYRCDVTKNTERLRKLQELFNQSGHTGFQPGFLDQGSNFGWAEIIHDCEQFPSCKPDPKRGLNYCQRDDAGLCGSCYVPGTALFNPARVKNQFQCSVGLFVSGAYALSGRPSCPSKTQLELQNTDFSCCRYLYSCPRSWDITSRWSECGSGACGEAFQIRPAKCTYQAELGDCRLDIGDPAGSGYCETEDHCFQARICHGQNCSWEPFCEPNVSKTGGSYQDDHAEFCMPTDWGPVESECAGGMSTRYKRCSVFRILNSSTPFCAGSPDPFSSREELVPIQSRIKNCQSCGFEGGPCEACINQDLFDLADNGNSCKNRKAMLVIRLEVSIPAERRLQFRLIPFQRLTALCSDAFHKAIGGLQPQDILILDAFNASAAPPPPPRGLTTLNGSMSIELDSQQTSVQADGKITARRLSGTHEVWTLIASVVLPHDKAGADLGSKVRNNSVTVSEQLEGLLQQALGVAATKPVTVQIGNMSLVCPNLLEKTSLDESCEAPDNHDSDKIPWKIIIIGASTLGALVLACAVVMGCRHYKCLCFRPVDYVEAPTV